MADNEDTVWTYWETKPGRVRPPYLDLCLDTIERHAAPLELRCLDEETTLDVLPDIDVERWRALPAPNYRSDYARSRVLRRYGGIWIDIDTVALGPLHQLLDELDDTGTVSFGKEHGRFFGGLCAARAGSPFVERWAEEQDKVLERTADWSSLPYAGLAQDVTWHLAREEPWKALPTEQVAPVPWFEWRRFFSRLESPRRVLAGQPVTVVLWNSVMAPRLRGRSHEEMLHSKMLVGRLLRIGLGTSGPRDEEDTWTAFRGLASLRFSRRGQRLETVLRAAASGRRRG